MAYGKIYTTNWFKDLHNNECKLFISKKNYSGATTNFKLLEGFSLNHSYRGGRDAENLSVFGSELNFSIWSQPQIQLFNDTGFDFDFNVWKVQTLGSLPWVYDNGNIKIEVDGADYSDYLYQDIVIKSGTQYKVIIDCIIDDPNTSHEVGIDFSNGNPLSGNQFDPFDVDTEFFDGVITHTFTANNNYSRAGLLVNAGGAVITIRSIKLYELGIDYSPLMEADYNEYQTTLLHKRQYIKNSSFDEPFAGYFTQSGSSLLGWMHQSTAAGVTYNAAVMGADGLSYGKYLLQDQNILKGQSYKLILKFGVDNDWNNSKIGIRFYQDPDFDPPTDVTLVSGTTSPSYLRSGVSLVTGVTNSQFAIEQYILEYSFTASTYYSKIGVAFGSADESLFLWDFELVNDETVFTGWVKPDNITKRFLNEQYYFNVNNIDGLADLKNFEFFVQPEYAPIIDVLTEVFGYTGLNLPLMIQNNIFHDTADAYPWYECLVDKRRWITDRKGKKTYASAYQVIEDILKPFSAQLKQINGRWLIQNQTENNTRRIVYLTGSTYLAGVINRIVDITKYSYIPDSDEVSKIQPAKGIDVTLDTVQFDESFVNNGRFDLNSNGWTQHSEAFTTFQRLSADGDGYLRTRRTSANDFTTMYFSGMTYLPNPSKSIGLGDTFNISMDVKVVSPTTDSLKPELRINAWRDYPTNVGEQRQIALYTAGEFPANEWVNVSEQFQIFTDMRNTFPTPIKVDIGIFTPAAANGQTLEVHFDNIKLEYDFAKDVNDKTQYYITLDTGNLLLETIKEGIAFGDGYYTNDISVIKLPNNKNTTLWRNADSSIDGVKIIELFARERLRQNLVYRDYLKCSIIDKTFSINPNSLLKLKDKVYKIVGYSRNFWIGQVDLELMEWQIGTIGDVQDYYFPSYTAFDY